MLPIGKIHALSGISAAHRSLSKNLPMNASIFCHPERTV